MGVRAGQGYGAAKPKRMMCPRCGKQGLKLWRAVAGAAGASMFRDCQYCNWSVAIGAEESERRWRLGTLGELIRGEKLWVRLSSTICHEYASRDVFGGGEWPEVDWDQPKWQSAGSTVQVDREAALSILDDAEYNGAIGRHRGQGPDEMPLAIGNAYRALARHLRRAVVQRGWLSK